MAFIRNESLYTRERNSEYMMKTMLKKLQDDYIPYFMPLKILV